MILQSTIMSFLTFQVTGVPSTLNTLKWSLHEYRTLISVIIAGIKLKNMNNLESLLHMNEILIYKKMI